MLASCPRLGNLNVQIVWCRALDNLVEGDLRVSSNSHPFDTPKQSYIQSMVSRLDW